MTLRSIDMQVMLPKIAEVHRNQPIQNQNDGSQQQQLAMQMQREAKHLRQQVQTSNKSEGSKIGDEQGKRHSSDQDQERKNNEKTEEQPLNAKDPARGIVIDVII